MENYRKTLEKAIKETNSLSIVPNCRLDKLCKKLYQLAYNNGYKEGLEDGKTTGDSMTTLSELKSNW